jgi:NAD dependent epimerase/dehydratase family enzyme
VNGRAFALALQAHYRTFVRAGVPAVVGRLLVGEMADELLLNGQRVLPQRLEEAGYAFAYRDLPAALSAIYGSTAK